MSNSFKAFVACSLVMAFSVAASFGQSSHYDVNNMDTKASACTDFYQYANGGWLAANPIPPAYPAWGLANILNEKNRDVLQPNGPDERVQKEILRLYKDSPECSILFELMTDFDEGLQEWRYRHVKLVERTIGAKKGTGGSPGVPFLKESLFRPVFHDLWAIRHEM